MRKNSQFKERKEDEGIKSTANMLSIQKAILQQKQPTLYELICLQNQLNHQLMINTEVLNAYVQHRKSLNAKIESSQASTNPSLRKYLPTQHHQKRPSHQKITQRKSQSLNQGRSKKKQTDSEYEPPQYSLSNGNSYRLSETKNIPKNYSKGIISFILKEKEYTYSVLQYLEVDETQFFSHIEKYKEKINSIAQLRAMWTEMSNPYAKALRILSAEYIRKYSLNRIYNSKLGNYANNAKYRYKIMNALEDPNNFKQMKDF